MKNVAKLEIPETLGRKIADFPTFLKMCIDCMYLFFRVALCNDSANRVCFQDALGVLEVFVRCMQKINLAFFLLHPTLEQI